MGTAVLSDALERPRSLMLMPIICVVALLPSTSTVGHEDDTPRATAFLRPFLMHRPSTDISRSRIRTSRAFVRPAAESGSAPRYCCDLRAHAVHVSILDLLGRKTRQHIRTGPFPVAFEMIAAPNLSVYPLCWNVPSHRCSFECVVSPHASCLL